MQCSVSVFDLVNNKSYTLPFENLKNIARMALSPQGHLLVTVDEDGRALLINFMRNALLHHFNFKEAVQDIKFSPDGRFIAVTHGRLLQVWRAPGFNKEFAPFVLHRTYNVMHVEWSPDSQFFLTAAQDMTCRLHSLHPIPGFVPLTFSGHRDAVISCFFSNDLQHIYTIGRDGSAFVYGHKRTVALEAPAPAASAEETTTGEERQIVPAETSPLSTHVLATTVWGLRAKHYFNQPQARVISACFSPRSNMLVAGFTNGVFALYDMPDFNNIHSLSISQHRISAVALNPTGEWLAFGCAKLGQLLVWEWQSETYILKQQGHYHDMSTIAYSSNGLHIATGGDDGKVKLWNTHSGFCFVTFSEHTAAITGVTFSSHGHSVFSSSLDGTVRAFDLVRYRNFRTFTSPRPAQFSCLALDRSDEIVCAASRDTFEIFVWSVQTGRLLEALAGHTGPVSGIAYAHHRSLLASCSWDKTVKFWDVFETTAAKETLLHQSDVLALAFRPDDQELCTATLDGQLCFWEVSSGSLVKSIEGRRDIAGGRSETERTAAANSAAGKNFTSVCYTADGACVLAGGNSKYVCIYSVAQGVLLRRFQISKNKSFDAMSDFLNSANMTAGGSLAMIDDSDDEADVEGLGKSRRKEEGGAGGMDVSLPGVAKGDFSSRRVKPRIRTRGVQFSPTGRSWAAASTEGLLIFSLDESLVFDPVDLDVDVTPDAVRQLSADGEHARALSVSFRLGEVDVCHHAIESVPATDIAVVVTQLSASSAERTLAFIASHALESSRHVHFYLTWTNAILDTHGPALKLRASDARNLHIYRALQKAISKHYDDLASMCDENKYALAFLTAVPGASADNQLSAMV
ncbi:WD repeat protein [Capsaspora owczarzaki ATCC 30864]|uniref:WD repeat protein n=2 Tax=Capsaspora owczarzaki (strain ATCC 30864) TaxID=595528 RepID=A0A0D2X1J8_CAPO3|nr:WD repeat protein [Capsaspora owczarzaki ATCC 30864]